MVDLVEILRVLNSIAVTIADEPFGGAKLTKSADAEIRQAAITRKLRDALDAELCRNVGRVIAVGLQPGGVLAIKPDACFVHERRAK